MLKFLSKDEKNPNNLPVIYFFKSSAVAYPSHPREKARVHLDTMNVTIHWFSFYIIIFILD